jgi:hypothetical protein
MAKKDAPKNWVKDFSNSLKAAGVRLPLGGNEVAAREIYPRYKSGEFGPTYAYGSPEIQDGALKRAVQEVKRTSEARKDPETSKNAKASRNSIASQPLEVQARMKREAEARRLEQVAPHNTIHGVGRHTSDGMPYKTSSDARGKDPETSKSVTMRGSGGDEYNRDDIGRFAPK